MSELKTFAEQADEASRLDKHWPECSTCLYWASEDDHERIGECRLRAPDAEAGWPTTGRAGWCGEWAQLR